MPRTLGLIALTAALAGPALAFDFEEPDPADLVPRYFSATSFATMSKSELYDVGLALKRGRNIVIEGCTASQSRAVFEASRANGAPAVEMLRTTCSG